MSGRKKIDTEHPRFQEYLNKCEEMKKELSEGLKPYAKYWGGMDGPKNDVYKKYLKQLTELQKEYSYLFTEED